MSCTWCIVYMLLYLSNGVHCHDDRHKLVDDLLGVNSSYRKEVTPIKDPSRPLLVSIVVYLHQIRRLVEPEQTLISLVWLRLEWMDEFLPWNEQNYGGIERIHIPTSDIWVPDIVLYNSVEDQRLASELMPETQAQISSDGHVIWAGTSLLKSSCKIYVSNYPFDVQNCKLVFGPWTYPAIEVNVTTKHEEKTLANFVRHGEWEINEMTCIASERNYSCCEEPYADVTCSIKMFRKPMFYIYNLILPCGLVLGLGSLVFWLSAESDDKITLCVSLVLALSVYQLIVMENIPHTSEALSLLDLYFGSCMTMLVVSTFGAVLVWNVNNKGNRGTRPPRWVRLYVINRLGPLLCMCKGTTNLVKSEYYTEQSETGPDRNKPDIKKTSSPSVQDLELDTIKGEPTTQASSITKSDQTAQEMVSATKRILQEMQDRYAESKQCQKIASEWNMVARVINRLFLIFYILMVIFITVAIFGILEDDSQDSPAFHHL